MTSCIFHMGYAKCGSTLLQERVFPALGDFDLRLVPTGDFFEGLGSGPVRQRVVSQMFTCSPDVWNIDKLAYGVFPENNSRNLLISEEALYTGNPSNVHIAAHIAAMAETAQRLGYGTFKLLAVHRRQDERMASVYAQNSRHWDNAGQEDFEDFSRRLIDPRRDLYRYAVRFDYAELAEILVARLGRENVAYVPLELLSIHSEHFASDLGAILGQAVDRTLFADHDVNVKRSGARDWKIPSQKYKGHTSLPRRLRNRLRRHRRPTSFTLSEALAAEIRATFAPGNRQLAEMFGYPLRELGYY